MRKRCLVLKAARIFLRSTSNVAQRSGHVRVQAVVGQIVLTLQNWINVLGIEGSNKMDKPDEAGNKQGDQAEHYPGRYHRGHFKPYFRMRQAGTAVEVTGWDVPT